MGRVAAPVQPFGPKLLKGTRDCSPTFYERVIVYLLMADIEPDLNALIVKAVAAIAARAGLDA